MPEPGLYADENVDGRLLRALKRLGWQVVRGRDVLGPGAGDELHFARAAETNAVLLSNDDDMLRIASDWTQQGRDFAALVYWHPLKYERVGDVLRAFLSAVGAAGELRGRIIFL